MRALTDSEIIEIWESGSCLHPIDRALAILQAVLGHESQGELAKLPLGRRDALLFSLRRSTFGDSLICKSSCAHCGETLELECSCSAVLSEMTEPEKGCIKDGDYSVKLRPLDSFDMAAAAMAESLETAEKELLDRIIEQAHCHDKPVSPDELPEEIRTAIAETVDTVDPYAEIQLSLHCNDCNRNSLKLLDITHILWLEISGRAKRLLMEIHLLAKNYGWGEAEILGLSPSRRTVYLQMVTA